MSGGLRERLGRLTKSGSAADKPRPALPDIDDMPQEEPEAESWGRLGFALTPGPEGACFVRDITYEASHQHGAFTVSELASAGLALSKLDPAGRAVEPEKLLFLDTETTGLGQGAGNVPFLIGIGWWSTSGFTVRQYFIRHPGEEAAMLAMLAETIPNYTHLVTYNGRTFDWPLVKNRYVMHRLQPPKDLAHFDFLYPSRSLWRTTMPSCRLGAVEEAKLGVFRKDDIPGSMAPALYFQYLTERNVNVIEGVFAHNETDIVTLLALAIHFGRLLDEGVAFNTLSAAELLRLALWYERLGFEAEAEAAMTALSARPVATSFHQLGEAALFYKRRKHWTEAVRLWRALVEGAGERRLPSLEPYVELAIAYEHRLKDVEAALYWADEALRAAQQRMTLSRAGEDNKQRDELSDIRKRKERLLKKQRTRFEA
jgi:uncharacterized protein YprB with RNaseH-like and TPR domain